MLDISGLKTAYGPIEVLHGIDFYIAEGEIVTLIGANGAGKTSLMHCISGLQPITAGKISFNDIPLHTMPDYKRAGLGIAHAPEGRHIFGDMIVEENLTLGAYHRSDHEIQADIDDVYKMFPVLYEKRHLHAGGLSGGQQQMLAIGRALMVRPKLLLLDEPSMGLAPILVDQIFETIALLRERGMTILLVEQNAYVALSVADRGYVLETGKIVFSGDADSLINDPRIREAYLGA
ncbi:MAG: ABC transporter ATP-binding protein [Hyphomicrobiales bacterium]|nr:MAG: ABC transporter ATP-binding protein [Hyphomicrobiales bacterium]